jgi:preprotein translocase subunit SecY
MACETCKGKEAHAPESVPYIVHESSMARMERQIKRLWIALIVSVVLLFASSAIFTLAWMQYDYSSEEIAYQQDGEGTNIIGDSNEVDNYGAESDNSEAQTNP